MLNAGPPLPSFSFPWKKSFLCRDLVAMAQPGHSGEVDPWHPEWAGGGSRHALLWKERALLVWLAPCCLDRAERSGGREEGPLTVAPWACPGSLGTPSTLCPRPGPSAARLLPASSLFLLSQGRGSHLSCSNICSGNHLSPPLSFVSWSLLTLQPGHI